MKKSYLRSLILLCSAIPMVAAAQTDEVRPRPIALDEVIVTAQKRAESLQDTPISITAFSSERLEIDGINNLNDIGAKVPSLTIEPFPINNATLRVFIRGIGISDTQVTQDPPIGIYVDGVYVARATGTAMDVADLERIEVLRGPQGTLYGRNTTGGAINFITKRPSADAFEFDQKFTVGNRSQFLSKTSANIPVTRDLAVKLAYMYSEMDGFIKNTGPGKDFGDRQVQGLRLDLRWHANDWLTVDYAYDKSDLNYVNYMYQAISRPDSDKGQAEPIKNSAAARAKFSTSRFNSMATSTPMQESKTKIDGHSLILTADFDNYQLKYTGAYRELDDRSYADLGGGIGSQQYRLDSNQYCGPAAQVAVGGCTPLVVPVITQDQWSHEFQITGDAFDGRIQYIGGLYFFKEEAQEDNSPLHHQLSAPVDDDPSGSTRIVNLLSQKYDVENEAQAVYGQFTWTPPVLEDRLHLTFGARYSQDKRKAVKFQEDLIYLENPLLPGGALEASNPLLALLLGPALGLPSSDARRFDNISASQDFTDASFSFVVEYDLTDDINVYAKLIEAYKSGGFNTRDPQRGATGDPATDDSGEAASDGNLYGFGFVDGFDEEKVRSLELGVKSELMNRRLRLNANAFYSEYNDIQLNILLAGTVADTKVANAGEAEMKGVEVDVTFLATRDVMLMFNYAYLDTEVTKATNPATGEDITKDFGFFSAPEHSYTAAVDWTILDRNWGRVMLNVSHNFMGDRNGGIPTDRVKIDGDKNRGTFLPSYSLTNARLSVSDIPLGRRSGLLTVGAWVKNLADEEYPITAIDNLPHLDRGVIWGEPRTYGVDVIYRY